MRWTPFLWLVCAAVGSVCCGGQSACSDGGAADGGLWVCEPDCGYGYYCDQQRRTCLCEGCCHEVYCRCDAGPFCSQGRLISCEVRPFENNDGGCGTECYNWGEWCQAQCFEFGSREAFCGDDYCGGQPDERFVFALRTGDPTPLACDTVPPMTDTRVEFSGDIVADATASFAVLDGNGQTWAVFHNLPNRATSGIYAGRPVSVELAWSPQADGHCIEELTVTELAGPVLFAKDGAIGVPQSVVSSVSVALMDLGCPIDPGQWCVDPATYGFVVGVGTAEPVLVLQGETVPVSADGQSYVVHNARSYVSGLCDDDWDYAFFVAEGN